MSGTFLGKDFLLLDYVSNKLGICIDRISLDILFYINNININLAQETVKRELNKAKKAK